MRITVNCILLLILAIECDCQYASTTGYAGVTTRQNTRSGGVTPCGAFDPGKMN